MIIPEKAVTAITLNPCIDRTLTIESLSPGGHHVAANVQETVAGKGIDVNVVLRHLGIPTCAVGFDFVQNGTPVALFLEQADIPFAGLSIPAPLRVNTKIFAASERQMTEINCKGPALEAREADAFLSLLDTVLPNTEILVVCGSVPPGIPSELYKTVIETAKSHKIRTILDATGTLLKKGLEACPDVIKPNIAELELLLGTRFDSRESCLAACRKLIENGVDTVCLTLGDDGALMVTKDAAWYSQGLDIPVRGVQGAGDSVVAGICAAMLKTEDRQEWLRSGIAAAHGSLIREGTLLCEKRAYEEFLLRIPVQSL